MMIIGHERNIAFLKRVLAENAAIHGFLFFGPAGVGKRTVALEFIRGLLCSEREWGGCGKCPICGEFSKLGGERDFLSVSPGEAGSIGIDEIRQAIEFLGSASQLANRKAVLIDEAERLTIEAQNAFLKTLEEPAGNSIIILTTTKPGRLAETVRSRLTPVEFRNVALAKIKTALREAENAQEIARIAFGRPGRALQLAADADLFRAEIRQLKAFERLHEMTVAERLVLAGDVSNEAQLPEAIAKLQLVLRSDMLAALGRGDEAAVSSRARALELSQWALATAEDVNVSKRLLMENLFLAV